MIELFKIEHNVYDTPATPALEINNRGLTRENKYKLLNKSFNFDNRNYSFTAPTSLPRYIVDVDSVHIFTEKAVFPSVRLSVKHVDCDKTLLRFLYYTKDHLLS